MKLRNRSLIKSVFALLLLGTSIWVSAQQKTIKTDQPYQYKAQRSEFAV